MGNEHKKKGGLIILGSHPSCFHVSNHQNIFLSLLACLSHHRLDSKTSRVLSQSTTMSFHARHLFPNVFMAKREWIPGRVRRRWYYKNNNNPKSSLHNNSNFYTFLSSFISFLERRKLWEWDDFVHNDDTLHTARARAHLPSSLLLILCIIFLFFSGPQSKKNEKIIIPKHQSARCCFSKPTTRPNVSEKVDTGRQKFII